MRSQSIPPTGYRSPAEIAGLPENTAVLVGFSGGADSLSLLHMLASESKRTGARIVAAHVNHGIRGEEADRDEEFCRRAAEELGVPFFSRRFDVPALAKERGKSVELTAREVRYEFFDSLMEREKLPLLVTAHHADDNLETMLFHLIRGTGLTGMCGIPLSRPCKHGLLVRPLLGVTRQELLAYCESAGLSYVTDSTNTDTSYTRNRIRSEVIPALLAIRREAVENSARTAENLRADERHLANQTELFLHGLPEGEALPLSRLQSASDAIARRALMARFKEASPNTDPEQCHVEAIRTLCQKGIPHTRVSLPDGTEGVIENGARSFRKKEELPEIPPYSQVLREGVQEISQTNAEIVISYSQKPINIYKNSILLSLDSATIKGVLTARRRLEGDRIRMGGMSRSIKKMFCDKKIPRELRSRLPVLCDEEGVVAVPLLGVRDGTAVSPETRDPLRVWVSLK